MPFPTAVVDLLIQTLCMDWLGHCQEVLEGNHSSHFFSHLHIYANDTELS
jgi:hypothetical protein